MYKTKIIRNDGEYTRTTASCRICNNQIIDVRLNGQKHESSITLCTICNLYIHNEDGCRVRTRKGNMCLVCYRRKNDD